MTETFSGKRGRGADEDAPTFGGSGSTRISGTRSGCPPSCGRGRRSRPVRRRTDRAVPRRGRRATRWKTGAPPPGAAEHGRRGGRDAALLLSRLGLSRQRPHLPDPVLAQGAGRPPRGVRASPVREAYGLVFVFPGDPSKADGMPLPELPEFDSERHKTMTYSRTVGCHYSFMHENLLDMNHQFLHRGVVGRIHPELLDYETGLDWVQARYQFTHTAGKKVRGRRTCSRPRPVRRRTSSPSAPATRIRRCSCRPGAARRRSRCGWPTCPRMRSSAPATPSAC